MNDQSLIVRALQSRRFLPALAIVSALTFIVFYFVISTIRDSNVVRPAEVTNTQGATSVADNPVADPDLDLRFSDPIVRLVPGERLLTISGTVYGIPMDRLTARIGFKLNDGTIIESVGSTMPTTPTEKAELDPRTGAFVPVPSESREINFAHDRQFEIPDNVTVAEPVVLLYDDAGNYQTMITGQPIDVSSL